MAATSEVWPDLTARPFHGSDSGAAHDASADDLLDGSGPSVCLFNHKELDTIDGGVIRIRQMLSAMRRMNAHVSVFTYSQSLKSYRSGDGLFFGLPSHPWPILRRTGSALYRGEEGASAVDIVLASKPSLAAHARNYVKACDVVQCEHIWSSFWPLVQANALGKPSVLDDHNVETLFARRLCDSVGRGMLPSAWLAYVKLLEGVACRLASKIIVTSEFDRQVLSRLLDVPLKKIEVVSNGTDTSRYSPSPDRARKARLKLGIGGSTPLLVFVGRLDFPPNLIAARLIVRDIAPEVLRRSPEARFLILGCHAPDTFVDSVEDPRIILSSDSDDVGYLNAADVCLAPMSVGSGTRIKVLNYFACGKAVVSTDIGAEGIAVRDGENVVISSLRDFPDRIQLLLSDNRLREEIGSKGRELVEEKYDWNTTMRGLRGIYSRICGSG